MKQRNSAILSYGRTIRKATANDVSLTMDFIRQGRAKMIAAGNVNQWSDKHPSRQTIEKRRTSSFALRCALCLQLY